MSGQQPLMNSVNQRNTVAFCGGLSPKVETSRSVNRCYVNPRQKS